MKNPSELQMESIKAYMDAGGLVTGLKQMRVLHGNLKDIAEDSSYPESERNEAKGLAELDFYDFVGAIIKFGGKS